MPIDHKRINGPEETVPYQLFTKLNTKTLSQQYAEAIKNNIRKDGRKLNEHRKIFLKTGVVSQAKGSAYIEIGETKVIVSVFDPREIPNKTDYSLKGEIYCEFKFAPFSCPKRRLHQQDAEEKHYSSMLKKSLESAVCIQEFPNFQVDIYALVLHNDGSALSGAITAAGLALAHAGIPMYDVITSVTIGVQKGKLLVDPTFEEDVLCQFPLTVKDDDDHGIITASVLSTHEQISQYYNTGLLDLESLVKSNEVIVSVCKEIVPLVQKCLVGFVHKNVTENRED